MEQELNLPYDRALSEAVWRRVAPELTPFAPLPADEAQEACCMAVPTEDGLTRLRRFIDEEVSMARAYRCHARSAPAAARRAMLRMADEELAHARTLLTAHYLMTGKFYQPPAAAGQEPPLPWCQLLRELYHEETCRGLRTGGGGHGGRMPAGAVPAAEPGGIRPRRHAAACAGKQLDIRE